MTIKKDVVKFTPTETKRVLKMRDSADYIMKIAGGLDKMDNKHNELSPELHVVSGYKVSMAK